MINRDQEIGQSVTLLRGDMTQQELAVRMRDLGWKWSQPTVWSIEKGERPLRLAEAEALARVFDVPLDTLLRSGPDVLIERRARDLEAASGATVDSLRRQLQVLRLLVGTAEEVRFRLSPETLETVTLAIEAHNPVTFARVVGEMVALEHENDWYQTDHRGPDSLESQLWLELVPDRLPGEAVSDG